MTVTVGDIVIVGGGPSGIVTALAAIALEPTLRRRMVVVEKGVYPRDKYCAGAFGRRGELFLERLGAVPTVPSAAIEAMSFKVTAGQRTVRVGPIGRVVRRLEFDAALADVAKSRGVKIIEGVRVDRVERVGPRSARVHTSQGTMDASAVIGCDGVGSVVRKALGLGAGRYRAQVLEVDTEPVAGDPARDVIHFDASDRRYAGYAWDFPTVVAGRQMVCRGIYHFLLDGEADVDLRKLLDERLAAMGLDLSKVKNKRFAERGFDRSESFASGPLMLAGEAAGIDPITGEGIAQAVEFGMNAGAFIARAHGLTRGLDDWNSVVADSRLARDLAVRTWLLDRFYGAMRARTEALLVAADDILFVGAQHFGGLPADRWRLARGVTRAAGALFAHGAADSLRRATTG